jgi:small-conductance mechanosensitive channel
MEEVVKNTAERLEAATTFLEETLARIQERQDTLAGDVDRISATVEQDYRAKELEEKLETVERELAELKAATAPEVLNTLRKTVPTATSEMLAKHGIGEGPVNVQALDAALSGLSLEQRIAVKTQLLRAGAIA